MSDYQDGYEHGLLTGSSSPSFFRELFGSASREYIRGLEAGARQYERREAAKERDRERAEEREQADAVLREALDERFESLEGRFDDFSAERSPPPRSMEERIAANPSSTYGTLSKLSRHQDASVRLAVASNETTLCRTLSDLSTDSDFRVRLAVANNPSAHSGTLSKLALDSNPAIRSAVASNPSTHPGTLSRLARGR